MFKEKLQDLSVVYWLKGLFSNITINVVDSFPEELLVVPTISVEADSIDGFVLELGNKNQEQIRVWTIDVFAVNKGQRDDLGYLIFNELDNGIKVYDYSLGFPPIEVPQIGYLDLIEKRLKVIRVYPELVDQMYYRCEITFSTVYEQI